MSRAHLYLLVSILTVLSLGIFLYKVFVLQFPLVNDRESPLWDVEAQVSFVARDRSAKVSLYIPRNAGRTVVMDESFISFGYGLTSQPEGENRTATWSARKVSGTQTLYYRGVVRRLSSADSPKPSAKRATVVPVQDPQFAGADLVAADSLLADITARSADRDGIVLGVIREINRKERSDNVKLLLGRSADDEKKAELVVQLLARAKIPSRVVHGIHLEQPTRNAPLLHWIEVFNEQGKIWEPYNVALNERGVPDEYFPWWRGSKPLAQVTNGDRLQVTVAVDLDRERAIQAAMISGRMSKPLLLDLSLFSLPLRTQAVYRIVLTIPLGAFLIVLLRNVIGLSTFGTFMPVLIALAFRETSLGWGATLFIIVVGLGLAVRAYFERLKLLLVPRLAATLSVVILIMAGLSIITHRLGIEAGLSVALFPMVILTMTIERMSIIWEEQGAGDALKQGAGSLVAATLAYLVMNFSAVQHLLFVFPELLLVVLSAILLFGRYTGYRLTELWRFRELRGLQN